MACEKKGKKERIKQFYFAQDVHCYAMQRELLLRLFVCREWMKNEQK